MHKRIVSFNHDGDKLTIRRHQAPYWLDLMWLLIYLAMLLCFLVLDSAWERHLGYQISNTALFAMVGVGALFNIPIIVPSLGGALSKRIYVFDNNAQAFYVNGVLMSRLSDVKQIGVQGRKETRGNYRCRVVVKLADRRTIVIAETRRVESLFNSIKEADTATKADKDKLLNYWVKIDRTHPMVNGSLMRSYLLCKRLSKVFVGRCLYSRRQEVTTVNTFDSSGSAAQRINGSGFPFSSDLYDAFGQCQTTASSPDVFGFSAQWGGHTDVETVLVLMTHRYYDPASGRFLTQLLGA